MKNLKGIEPWFCICLHLHPLTVIFPCLFLNNSPATFIPSFHFFSLFKLLNASFYCTFFSFHPPFTPPFFLLICHCTDKSLIVQLASYPVTLSFCSPCLYNPLSLTSCPFFSSLFFCLFLVLLFRDVLSSRLLQHSGFPSPRAGINHSPFHTWQSVVFAGNVCMLLDVALLMGRNGEQTPSRE